MNNFISREKLLLLILPVVYLFIAGAYLINRVPFYISSPDPVYAYLFNGMTLASGKIEIGHTDHPGTPIQCFTAAVIFIKHLFNRSVPLYQDVILHPENYLHVICIVISMLFVLATWYTGYYLFKRTKNIVLALLFQLTPLIGSNCAFGQNPQPESFIIIFGMLFMAYIYYHSVFNSSQKPRLREIIIYSAFSGFLIACKYTCAPLLLLVIFLLPAFRSKIGYVVLSALFFLLFISPALSAWNSMFQWVYNLATHTGQYGSGDKGIINPHEFLAHGKDIFMEDFYFTSLYFLLCVALFVAFVKRKQVPPENKIYLSLLCGVWASSTLLILLVVKHYSFHYILPIKLCYPLIIAGSYRIFTNSSISQLFSHKRFNTILFYFAFGLLIFINLERVFADISRPISYSVSDCLKKYPNEPIIISSDFQCARIESSLDFGALYTANSHFKYWDFLKKIYPYSYLYKQHPGIISYWDDVAYTPELFAKYPKILVYFYNNPLVQRDSVLVNFCNWNHTFKIGDYKLIYAQPETNEYIYELSGYQNNSKALLADYTQTDFNFENLSIDKLNFISTDSTHLFKVTNPLSNQEHHSGNTSILLNEQNIYTASYSIKAEPGSIVVVSIWRKSKDRKSNIVLTSSIDGNFYNSGQANIDSDANGWKKIEYKCLVTSYIKDSAVAFYLYYYGHGSAYFDDLSIKVYSMKLNNSAFTKKD